MRSLFFTLSSLSDVLAFICGDPVHLLLHRFMVDEMGFSSSGRGDRGPYQGEL
jgi:hypothetical protein